MTAREKLLSVGIVVQFSCVAIVLFFLDAIFRWIGNSHWLWQHKIPWIVSALDYVMYFAVVVGIALSVLCVYLGSKRQKLLSLAPGLFLTCWLIFLLRRIFAV